MSNFPMCGLCRRSNLKTCCLIFSIIILIGLFTTPILDYDLRNSFKDFYKIIPCEKSDCVCKVETPLTQTIEVETRRNLHFQYPETNRAENSGEDDRKVFTEVETKQTSKFEEIHEEQIENKESEHNTVLNINNSKSNDSKDDFNETNTKLNGISKQSIITDQAPSESDLEINPKKPIDNIKNEISGCDSQTMEPRIVRRGNNYWVLQNYIRAEATYSCNETVTFTTQSEFSFLDNLQPILTRWQGPVSVAIFTPGDDYESALKSVLFYRNCVNSTLIKEYATFHFFFPGDHIPKKGILNQTELTDFKVICSELAKWTKDQQQTYRRQKELDYPINVGRNIARESAKTHFIFPADIELYPSPGLIPLFLEMVGKNEPPLSSRHNPRVFVLPIFEIKSKVSPPESKSELIKLLDNEEAVIFHQSFCAPCHTVPKFDEWKSLPETDGLSVFHVAKRVKPHIIWEPIFIGLHQDPLHDERLSWEGRRDKMTQSYQLCLMDYDFMILDNAFLIHRPGIKSSFDNSRLTPPVKAHSQATLINTQVIPEINAIYGERNGC